MSVETLFREALACADPRERAAFLQAACAGQPDVLAQVKALLAAHAGAEIPLDSAACVEDATREFVPEPAATSPPVTVDHQPTDGPGMVVAGKYVLENKLGEGGMGEVWVARQTVPIKRRVALKVIKAGMDSRAVVQRFEQERQALAVMDHPNIAKVLDAGLTGDRRPFFAMEVVNGLPVTTFCDEARLTPQERLELFIPICQAVQHAHQKGIIHRDLKPGNILVTMIDGRPVPKVIDFGVAKAVSGKLTDETMATQFGAVLGTFEYMAPEQAGYSGQDVDTRADIYALGVILYELLTGLRPFDSERLRNGALEEILRILREEEPPRPSTRASSSEHLPSLAEVRRTDPRKLTALVKGDLDWIVMKCLEKDRNRRYETANQVAADLRRFLADEPVLAGPPTVGYRMRKFARRYRGEVLGAALLLGALLAGLAGTLWGLVEAQRQRDDAQAARENEAALRTAAVRERDAKEQARLAEAAERHKAETERKTAQAAREKAVSERDARQREAQRADGLRLAAEARVAVRHDPALAFRLAMEATRLHQHHLTFGAFYEAQAELREERLLAADSSFRAARFSPDGRRAWALRERVADRSSDGGTAVLTVHDAATGQTLASWPGVHAMDIERVDCSPDGKWLAIVHRGSLRIDYSDGRQPAACQFTGHVVHLVDAATGRGIRNLGRHDEQIVSVQFSPDCRHVLTSSLDKTARLWDVATGKEVCRFQGHKLSLRDAQFSPDGRRVLTLTSGMDQSSRARNTMGGLGLTLMGIRKDDPLAGMFSDENGSAPLAWLGKAASGETIVLDPVVTADRPVRNLQSGSSHGFITGTDVKLAGLWDAATGQPLADFRKTSAGQPGANLRWTPTRGAFSPDGTQVALAFDNGIAALWDAAGGGEEKVTFIGHTGQINDVAFGRDGTRVATAGQDGSVRLWDATTGRELLRLRGHQGQVQALQFDRAGTRLLSRSLEDRSVRVWDTVTGLELAHLRGSGPFRDAWFNPEETHVITAGAHSVSMWSLVPMPGPERVVLAHERTMTALTYSPHGAQLLTASADGTAKQFDAATGRLIHVLGSSPKQGPMRSAAYSPDGRLIVTASEVQVERVSSPWSVHVWDAATGAPRFQLRSHDTGAAHAAFTPDGQRLLTVDDGHRNTRGQVFSYSSGTADKAGKVRLWDVSTQQLLHTLPDLAVGVPLMSGDGRFLFLRPKFAGGIIDRQRHGGMTVFDGMTLKEAGRFGLERDAKAGQPPVSIPPSSNANPEEWCIVSPDGRRAVVNTWNHAVLWEPATDRAVAVLNEFRRVGPGAFSPDGKRFCVAVGTKGYVLEAETGTILATLSGHEGNIVSLAFSPDGTQVLTGSADKTAARWHADTGKLEAVYMGHKEPVAFLAFRPDGQQAATAIKSGEVRLWPLDPVKACLSRAPRDLTVAERERYEVVGPPVNKKSGMP